jgi:predicted anti-sigma-YlaC factor YlaD
MISCAEAVRQLWSYLEDEVSTVDRQLVTEHLEVCRKCCGEVEFLGELRRFVASSELPMPPDVGARMEAFLATLEGSHGRPDVQG